MWHKFHKERVVISICTVWQPSHTKHCLLTLDSSNLQQDFHCLPTESADKGIHFYLLPYCFLCIFRCFSHGGKIDYFPNDIFFLLLISSKTQNRLPSI
jgi:hypothetical protein